MNANLCIIASRSRLNELWIPRTDDDELDEETAGRMRRHLTLVQASVSLLHEADLQRPVLRLKTEMKSASSKPFPSFDQYYVVTKCPLPSVRGTLLIYWSNWLSNHHFKISSLFNYGPWSNCMVLLNAGQTDIQCDKSKLKSKISNHTIKKRMTHANVICFLTEERCFQFADHELEDSVWGPFRKRFPNFDGSNSDMYAMSHVSEQKTQDPSVPVEQKIRLMSWRDTRFIASLPSQKVDILRPFSATFLWLSKESLRRVSPTDSISDSIREHFHRKNPADGSFHCQPSNKKSLTVFFRFGVFLLLDFLSLLSYIGWKVPIRRSPTRTPLRQLADAEYSIQFFLWFSTTIEKWKRKLTTDRKYHFWNQNRPIARVPPTCESSRILRKEKNRRRFTLKAPGTIQKKPAPFYSSGSIYYCVHERDS